MTNKSKNVEDRVFDTLDKIKERIAQANQTLLKVSDETVEGALKAGKEWQKLMKESIKKSEKLLENQQEIAFEALEGIKEIHLENRKRFRALLQEEKVAAKKAATKAAAALEAAKEVSKEFPKTTLKEELTDLKTIKGIGPKLEEILKSKGVQSVQDIEKAPLKRLEAILAEAGSRYKGFDPQDWKKQAKELV
ncbi:MAG TPA: helix-hairpin-helix domain-containing protein [Saprospiraceae bacterium]|nr:helix-hairpin-helix domain-containing protein [Saprospiraceae bacterium]